jgi:large subunit ribosomal protein L22
MIQEISHHTRSIRVAPRKMREVIDKIRNQKAEQAMGTLPLINRAAARPAAKALKAAIMAARDANLDPSTLMIQRVWCDEGTALKRIIRFSRGRSAGMMKKYCHLTFVLSGELLSKPAPAKKAKKADTKEVTAEAATPEKESTESAAESTN